VLVGTASVEKSELLSAMLLRRGIPHEVLNAKYHEKEAAIVAQAGRRGAVTVATNMAGRGTDIMLGGNPEFMADLELREQGWSPAETPEAYETAWEPTVDDAKTRVAKEHDLVVDAGGLYVLGTERHESRRIDNQLRGRSGRQGDPGESRFYLSLGDDLMKRFNANAVEAIMTRLNIPDDEPIESKMVSRAIKSAQTQVEQQNFEIRKNVLKYDEVMNKQREVIYAERRRVLEGADLHEQVLHMINDVVTAYVEGATAEGYPEDWDLGELWKALRTLYPVSLTVDELVAEVGGDLNALSADLLLEEVRADAQAAYDAREAEIGEEMMRELERRVVLSVLDRKWREHLYEMDYLQEGIGLRAMAQRDPLVEYQREGFDMFNAMLDGIKEESVTLLFHAEIQQPAAPETVDEAPADGGAADEPTAQVAAAPSTSDGRSGRSRGRHAAPEPAGRPRQAAALLARDDRRRMDNLQYSAPTLDSAGPERKSSSATSSNEPGRNAPCPCGSGKKYKRCHGAPEAAR
jgi:preprotein translocase subunit SecA